MKVRFISNFDSLWVDKAEFIGQWFSEEYKNNLMELIVIVPDGVNSEDINSQPEDAMWYEISHAWYQIRKSQQGTQLKSWRVIYKHGDEIAPGLGVFRLKGDVAVPTLFWLSSGQTPDEIQANLADLFPKISSYWHVINGRGLFHAAGVLHGEKAYLFVGFSGAGKSTVSALSSMQGDKIIHDDHVVLYPSEADIWHVSDSSYLHEGVPVTSIFFLVQDKEDYLLSISTAKIVKGLTKSLREHGEQALFGETFLKAFHTCSEIARHVPGYELHFRKSPDFWRLIDEQFPD